MSVLPTIAAVLDPSAALSAFVAASYDTTALIVAIVSAAAAVGALLYAASADARARRADERSQRALELAEKADQRQSEAHDTSKRANLILDGFKLSELGAEHFYATLTVKNIGPATARDISVTLRSATSGSGR